VWTTWAISYQAIRDRHEHTANLLLLWSFLDNKDLWHGLFATACDASAVAAAMLSGWIGDIASSKVQFSGAMQLLRNYSLVEEITETTSYATHPVVHRWARHSQGKRFATELSRLSVIAVGWAVPGSSARDYSALQRQLLPHAQACSRQIVKEEAGWCLAVNGGNGEGIDKGEKQETVLDAIHLLGDLYKDQGKLGEAEQMYERALRGKEEALGPTHTSTLGTVNNLGRLYSDQGKLGEAEQMYERALRGKEEALGPTHTSTLSTVNNLGLLYADQGKLVEAEQMYERALRGRQEALGSTHTSTLDSILCFGVLYVVQGKLGEAEQMYKRALQGYEEALGPTHMSTLGTVNNLGNLYADQRKLGEAEQMYERALRGFEEALGPTHTSTLDTVNNLGGLYYSQGKLGEAEQMFERALRGYEAALSSDLVQQYKPALNTLENMGDLYALQAEIAKAQAMYARALSGLSSVLGQSNERCMDLAAKIDALPPYSGEREVQLKLPRVGSGMQHDRRKKSLRLSIRKLVRKVF
jgi:tetratricopeptide (TPR) repeat protein